MLLRAILAIYLAHLLTDFVLQSQELVEQKRRRKLRAYAKHGIIHYVSAMALAGFLIPGAIVSWRVHLVIFGLTLLHLLIDFAKLEFARRSNEFDGPLAYISDQILHLVSILFAAWLIVPGARFAEMAQWIGYARNMPNKFLAVPVVYGAVLFGGGYLIRVLTGSLAEGVKGISPETAGTQLQNAGLYIGWLERFLVVTALLLHSPATVGFIFTAKSIARYPEFKSERFAEYFLIGTLLSISIAITAGALLAMLLFGQVRFS
jgi:hypothetical protein